MPLMLTDKEKQLAQLLKAPDCFIMAEIAERAGLSINQTKAMAKSLYRAFGVSTREQFALFFNLPLNHHRVTEWITKCPA